jgi:hypothetical protein
VKFDDSENEFIAAFGLREHLVRRDVTSDEEEGDALRLLDRRSKGAAAGRG